MADGAEVLNFGVQIWGDGNQSKRKFYESLKFRRRKHTKLVNRWAPAMGFVFPLATYKSHRIIIGFLRVPGCPRGGGNWGTLRIPFGKIGVHLREDERGITNPP